VKIIIDIDDGVDYASAMAIVRLTMDEGLCSESRGINKFAHVTAWQGMTCYCRDRRGDDSAHSFRVSKSKAEGK
jgi:hypothetical protein